MKASSLSELQDLMFKDSWDPSIKRFRTKYAFRGLTKPYELKTSLIRLGGDYKGLEKHLIRNFKKYAHRDVEANSIWDWLSIAQHHGLPTRLLDWTFSPFVAMHFATANLDHMKEDGIIWCVNYFKTHKLLPSKLLQIRGESESDLFTTEMLSEGAEELQDFDNLSKDVFCVFFEPPSLDDRIVNQSALFSVMSDPQMLLDTWLQNHKDLALKIEIPASLKWEIRDKLDQANITERVLFPGLDGLSSWLKRWYCPKTPFE